MSEGLLVLQVWWFKGKDRIIFTGFISAHKYSSSDSSVLLCLDLTANALIQNRPAVPQKPSPLPEKRLHLKKIFWLHVKRKVFTS